jgi:Na+-transporting NADH:ubiquinone oxidoreductase subunit C
MIDLDSGEFIEGDPLMFDERRDARDVEKSDKPENDIAGINRRAHNSVVYIVRNGAGEVETVVLPIVGSGLWDLMFGYVGLEADLNTVKSVIYSDHKETPGLGAEVMNPKWKALWPGKKIFDQSGEPAIKLVKGGAKADDINGVDALSGATLTSNGVTNTLQFWFGEEGYGPFIAKNRGGLK